ncbi:SoxR reducing system RseC family protein [Pontibacter sp. JAM-7]|uniref:SoxR reducing system RseC family protein n=1 Tax=Pontibacter sp. JAM-7 TaxID=3366581 RepID=UPI003AF65B06
MIEEHGRVVEVGAAGIWVETTKTSTCAACAAKHGCGQKLLVQASGQKAFVFKVLNPADITVHVDDSVMVGVEEGALLKATLTTYLLPLLLLILSAVAAHLFALPEPVTILIALTGLAFGFLAVRFASQLFFRSTQFQPVLTRIVLQETSNLGV